MKSFHISIPFVYTRNESASTMKTEAYRKIAAPNSSARKRLMETIFRLTGANLPAMTAIVPYDQVKHGYVETPTYTLINGDVDGLGSNIVASNSYEYVVETVTPDQGSGTNSGVNVVLHMHPVLVPDNESRNVLMPGVLSISDCILRRLAPGVAVLIALSRGQLEISSDPEGIKIVDTSFLDSCGVKFRSEYILNEAGSGSTDFKVMLVEGYELLVRQGLVLASAFGAPDLVISLANSVFDLAWTGQCDISKVMMNTDLRDLRKFYRSLDNPKKKS